jgi:hypothetical protein
MNIKMVEYLRGVTVKLELRDADMKCIGAAKEAFVNLCTQVDEQAPEQEDTEVSPEAAQRYWNNIASAVVHADQMAEAVVSSLKQTPEPAPLAEYEAPKRRGRPRKNQDVAETVAEDKEPSGEPEATQTDTPAIDTPIVTESTAVGECATDADTPSAKPPVNDADVQKYCASLAKHFGDKDPVFEMAKQFVPEGTVARPSNIRDNEQRWAFIEKAQAETGVMYHG